MIVDPGLEHVELADVQISSIGELRKAVAAPGAWGICYHNDHLEADLEVLCRAACNMGRVWLVLEEASMFMKPSYIPPQLKRLVEWCRHNHVGYVVNARRPRNEIHNTLTSLSWELFCFHLNEPAHLKYVRDLAGVEFAARVAALPPHVCLWKNLYDATEPVQELHPPKAA